jgi:PilZ domain
MLNYSVSTEKQTSMLPMSHGRNVPRVTATGHVTIRSILTRESAEGTLVDISGKGVRLTTDQRFQRDQKLALTLALPWDKPPIDVLLAAVKWVRGNDIGVEFIDLEADNQVSLHAFLQSRSKT